MSEADISLRLGARNEDFFFQPLFYGIPLRDYLPGNPRRKI